MFTRILVPIDLSPSSEAALDVARRHCVADSYKSTLASPVEVAEVRKRLEHEALRKLHEIAQPDEEPMVVVGKAAEMILDHVQEWKPDLLVMGTHGRTGIAHFLNGSVAESVVRGVRLPVLIVHEQAKIAK